MTKFLASIENLQEAERALAAGIDVVDIVVTGDGGDQNLIREIVAFATGRVPVSISIPWPENPDDLPELKDVYAPLGADWLLITLPFDQELDPTMLPHIAKAGLQGIKLDLKSASDEGLFHSTSYDSFARMVDQARALKLKIGFAGALESPDVSRLLPLQPDFLGIALSSSGMEAFGQIRAMLSTGQGSSPEGEFLSAGSAGIDFETDKIFVRDYVLPVEIGAYNHERGKPQKVRFDVIAEVQRITNDPQDMRHVVSYDVIMDGIRAIVARGHVDLAEALAEQVASHVLADRRVVRVTVRVEKLEIAPCRVGVEIERTRAGYDARQTKI